MKESSVHMNIRISFTALVLCLCLLCTAALPSLAAGASYDGLPRDEALPFAVRTYAKEVTLPTGRGPLQYYAQNDPSWFDVLYEPDRSKTRRTFGAGGCNPTAMAMIVANLVPEERLPELIDSSFKGNGYTLCECALYGYFCHRKSEEGHRITLSTPEEFKALLPLALGMYAAGNNKTHQTFRAKANGDRGGTTWDLFEYVAKSYNLTYAWSRDAKDMMRVLDAGGLGILLCSGGSQPFSNSTGHYVVVADYDDTYFYFLDPFVRDEYARDKDGIIEPVETSVKKVKIENLPDLFPSRFFMFLPTGVEYVKE